MGQVLPNEVNLKSPLFKPLEVGKGLHQVVPTSVTPSPILDPCRHLVATNVWMVVLVVHHCCTINACGISMDHSSVVVAQDEKSVKHGYPSWESNLLQRFGLWRGAT